MIPEVSSPSPGIKWKEAIPEQTLPVLYYRYSQKMDKLLSEEERGKTSVIPSDSPDLFAIYKKVIIRNNQHSEIEEFDRMLILFKEHFFSVVTTIIPIEIRGWVNDFTSEHLFAYIHGIVKKKSYLRPRPKFVNKIFTAFLKEFPQSTLPVHYLFSLSIEEYFYISATGLNVIVERCVNPSNSPNYANNLHNELIRVIPLEFKVDMSKKEIILKSNSKLRQIHAEHKRVKRKKTKKDFKAKAIREEINKMKNRVTIPSEKGDEEGEIIGLLLKN